MAPSFITYAQETNLSNTEYQDILQSSTLAERRPEDPNRLNKMLQNSNLIFTARQEGKLVGLARCITDHGYICYISDLATSTEFQGQGIGKELIKQVRNISGPEVTILLLSAPKAVPFYENIGMVKSDVAYTFSRKLD